MAIQVTVMSIDFDSFEEPITKVFKKNEITLGRTPNNDLVLDRPEVSSIHARLSVRLNGHGDEPHLYVTDLGSSNGTMLERDGLAPDVAVPIQANQRLIIGSYLIKPSIVGGLETAEQERAEESGSELDDEEGSEEASIWSDEPAETVSGELLGTHAVETLEELPDETQTDEREAEEDFDALATEATEPGISTALPRTVPGETTVPSTVVVALEGDAVLDLNFDACALFSLSGRITHRGDAVEKVLIDAGDIGTSETTADGKFSFSGLEEGSDYRLTLSKPGYLFEPAVLTGTLEGDVGLHISAIKLHQLSGVVLHKGRPLAGVRIDGGSLGATVTGPDGSYIFRDVREGSAYSLSAEFSGYIFDCVQSSGTLDGDKAVDFSARQLLKIGGKVAHKGRPLAGVEIECVNLGKATTDADGMYYFENVPEGVEYTIRAIKPGFKLSQRSH
jgi:pSer/pThr/pTyr-binding forkhead associated (FHA) protein